MRGLKSKLSIVMQREKTICNATIAWLVVICLLDGLLTDVCPEDQPLREEEVHRNCVQATDHHSGLRPSSLCIHQSNIAAICEQQQRGAWAGEGQEEWKENQRRRKWKEANGRIPLSLSTICFLETLHIKSW